MKLTTVSITIAGRRYTAFVNLPHGMNSLTHAMLCQIFPEYNRLRRGETVTIG